MTNRRLAILGAGNMGRAIIGGLLRSGTRPEHLQVGERSGEQRALLSRELGLSSSADNAAAVRGATVVVVAVKPSDVIAVLAPLAALLESERPLLISVAAGIRIATLAAATGGGIEIVRAMPNRAALVGAGATGLYAPSQVGAAARASAAQVLGSVGEVAWVASEDALDVVTALSGSGPAYFFLLAEHMAEAAQALGLEAPIARQLARMTLYGAGVLARSGDADLARLRAEVTSPGGTTEAALRVFERAKLREIIAQALGAAVKRGHELAASGPKP
ncbi:MAG TPA: pyrroline-5-carboxylate reductase [Steroidobacteraceae bacterium]|nr:pyrroline-5-carboxylate reductase [Steroidobacteraceae bacterium]